MNSKKTLSILALAAGMLTTASFTGAQQPYGGQQPSGGPQPSGAMGSPGTAMPGGPPPDAPMPASPAPSGAMPDQPMPAPGKATGPAARPGARPGAMPSATAPSGDMPMGSASPYAPKKWNKGDRLPAEFRDRQYVIDDWKQYNLPAPKKGRHWVGVGADYYLVTSNGKIEQVGAGGSQ